MKKLFFVASISSVLLVSSVQAAGVKLSCEGRTDARNDGYALMKISLNSRTLQYAIYDENNKSLGTSSASRDRAFDEKHLSGSQIRMYDPSSGSPLQSDSGASLFVDKTLLEGKDGRIIVSTGQPGDGDGGPGTVYSSDTFDCVSQ